MYRAGLKIVFIFVKSYEWKFIKCFGSKMKISRIQYKSLSKANVTFSNTRLIYNITAEHFKLNFSRVKLLTRKWPKLANIPPFLWISSVFDSLSPKGNFLLLRERFQTRPPWTTWSFASWIWIWTSNLHGQNVTMFCIVLHTTLLKKKLIKKDINVSHRTFSGRFVNHIKLREKTDKKT